MRYIFIFLLLNFFCMSQSYIIKPRDKVHNKRNIDLYTDVVRLDGDGKKESGGGVGGDCDSSNNCGKAPNPLSINKSDPKTKASNIAQKAAQEAKAANDAQMAAADAAASQVKVELADKALQSARAAEAALAGKQQIMEQLESEHREAEAVVQEVNSSLQNTQANAAAAFEAANDGKTQVSKLQQLVQTAIKNLNKIESVASGAEQELSEKTQLLEAAKNRVKNLECQLTAARQDFEKTKQAAYKAACSAVEAGQKAQRNRRMNYQTGNWPKRRSLIR